MEKPKVFWRGNCKKKTINGLLNPRPD